MPELPEVETTLRGIKPHIEGQEVVNIIVRNMNLRWPVKRGIKTILQGETLTCIKRRGKYLLFEFACGTAILHLGMSGSVRIISTAVQPKKHDHIDICFANNKCLRLTDPRRFGAFLFTTDVKNHPLLKNIGPEPLEKEFTGAYLFEHSRKRKTAIKSFLMNSKIVAGIGNIYAAEALFQAGIHPLTQAGNLNLKQMQDLARAIKKILRHAIKQGGTTLRDFITPNGNTGYFRIKLQVYGRDGQDCLQCGSQLKHVRISKRSTVFCSTCQQK